MSSNNSIIRVEKLCMHFPITRGTFFARQIGVITAVDDITLEIRKGEILGLVGESGCGKSTFGRTIIQLYRPTAGKVYYRDVELTKLKSGNQLRKVRRNMQMLFQDPYASLNPRLKVAKIIAEPLEAHETLSKNERNERVKELLKLVGLSSNFMNRYPHEFSGGQRQRIGIARALAIHPEFIVLDEPISALDVSVQAQIMNLLEELQETLDLTYLVIAHDLGMVRHISDRIAVMYLGKIVELAPQNELFVNPIHPYTKALISAVPIPNPRKERSRERIILTGDIPSPQNISKGCRFNTRCPYVFDTCKIEQPDWRMVNTDHWVACFLPYL